MGKYKLRYYSHLSELELQYATGCYTVTKKPVRTASQGIKAKLKENVCIDPCPKESKDINSNVL